MALSYEWTPEEQREYSLARLFKYADDYIFPHHPWYRRLLNDNNVNLGKLKSYQDLQRIPFTTKADLYGSPREFMLLPGRYTSDMDVEELSRGKEIGYIWKTLISRYLRDTFGRPRPFVERVRQVTAGDWSPVSFDIVEREGKPPAFIAYTAHDVKNVVPNITGMLYLFGIEPTMRGLNLVHDTCHAFPLDQVPAMAVDNGIGIHTCRSTSSSTVEGQVRIASIIPFDFLISSHSRALEWAEMAHSMIVSGEAAKPDRLRFLLFCDDCPPGFDHDRLRDRFVALGITDIVMIESYGSPEMRACFFECGEKGGFHLNPEFFFWEVLDPHTREPVESWGEPGVLVFSHIDWRGTVLLRYWTGDYVTGGVVWERCENCGLTLPVIRGPIQRGLYPEP